MKDKDKPPIVTTPIKDVQGNVIGLSVYVNPFMSDPLKRIARLHEAKAIIESIKYKLR